MTARFCPYCGQPIVAGGTFCPSCGAAVGGSPTLPTSSVTGPSFGAPVGGPPLPYPPGFQVSGGPTPASRAADLSALSSVTVASIVAFISTVVGLVVLVGTNASAVLSVSTSTTTPSVSLDLAGLYLLAVTAGVSLILTILELIFYRSAFRTLAGHDPRFSTPASLVLLVLVALALVLVLGGAIVVVVYRAIVCAGAGNPITSACLDVRTALTLILLLGVIAIVALVGYFGLLMGIWRLGTRYGESLFKAGAVLLIIPYLSVLGVILILVAARSSRAKLAARSPSTPFG